MFWRHKQLPKEQDNGSGPALVSVTLQKKFKLILAINSSSFWPWEPVPNSGKGKEKTFRVLLQGRYTWFLVPVDEMREVPAAWRTVGRMGVKKCSTTEVPDAPQPFAPKVLSLPPPLMQ